MRTLKFMIVPLLVIIVLNITGCSGKKGDPAPVEPNKPAVTITAFTPEKAIVYSAVTIKGSNFSTDVNKLKVTFNGAQGYIYSATATEVLVGIPPNAASGKIVLTSDGTAVTTVNDFKILKGTQTTFASGYFEHIGLDAAGNIYGDGATINPYRPAVLKGTVAGVVSVVNASFANMWGTAVDASGNIFIALQVGAKIIKITPAGVVSNFAGGAGVGFLDATGTAAKFTAPFGLTIDAAGNLYTMDVNRVRKITPAGVVSTLAGNGTAGFSDGTGTAALIGQGEGLTTDAEGNVYTNDNNALRKISPAGVVTTIAGGEIAGFADGLGRSAQFYQSQAMAVDAAGNVFIANNLFSTNSVVFTIRMVNKAGHVTTFMKTTYASDSNVTSTVINGAVGTTATSNFPDGIAFDAAGNMYICNTGASLVSKITFN